MVRTPGLSKSQLTKVYKLFFFFLFMKKAELILDDWQKQILEYKGSFLLCTGRQVGKTTIMAIKAAEFMINNRNSQIIVVSLTEDQAKLIIVMILDYLEKHYKPWLKVAKSKKPTQSRITLSNGSSVIARPVGNTGDAVRGFTGDVLIIDEASRMPELAFAAATPVLMTTGGQIWICSTPAGKQGFFWRQYDAVISKRSDRFKIWHISSEEVIYNRPESESWTEAKREDRIRFLENEKATKSKLEYGQEYLGEFMEDLMRYFQDEWIDDSCKGKPEPRMTDANYYLGVDIARMGGDETTFEIIRKVNKDTCIHVYHEAKTQTPTTWTEERIKELDKLWNFRKIYIDAGAGSLGVGILDHLLNDSQTKRKVEAVNNRKIVLDRDGKSKQRMLKEDLYDNLKNLGEKKQIVLLDDENVRLSLRSVQYEYIQKQAGFSQLRIFGNYTHIAEGLIRAAVCVKEKNIKPVIYSFRI